MTATGKPLAANSLASRVSRPPGCLHHDQGGKHLDKASANLGDAVIVIGDMDRFTARLNAQIQRVLRNIDSNKPFHQVLVHTHPCKNAGLLAQATVRVVGEKRCDAPSFSGGLGVPREDRAVAPQTKKTGLCICGQFAGKKPPANRGACRGKVARSRDFPTARPFAHKLHRPRSVLVKKPIRAQIGT